MRNILILFVVVTNVVYASENKKEINSKITRATVYLEGAQVTRESKLNLQTGKTQLAFKGLSPYIDKNSIKVKGVGNYTILSVNHSINYLENPERNSEFKMLNDKIVKLRSDIELKTTERNILIEKKEFMDSNKNIISDQETISPNDFKLFKEIFSTETENLQLSILKKKREIDDLNEEISRLNKQIQEISSEKDMPTSEIIVAVSAAGPLNGKINLSYFVGNAGWYPTYDIRVDDINEPAVLNYKANVYQNTGIDWKNVTLTFSNATPSEAANIPYLNPYYLDFYQPKVYETNYSYNPNIRQVKGKVTDAETGEPIPFANIFLKDKTIGTTTDFDGKFSLSIPYGVKSLVVTYVGYETKEVGISNAYLDVKMNASILALEQITLVEYGAPVKAKDVGGIKRNTTVPLDVETTSYKTNFEFNIKTPYSLKSNASNIAIDMKKIELNTSYVYKSIPKINPVAFLVANIIDWEDHSLLDGEVNLYFENTYVGKSVLDLAQMSDTLEVSLGPDNNISVKRVSEKDFTSNQFLGSNKIVKRVWKTTIRNNKSRKINLILYDQIPVSKNEKISVDIGEMSKGKLNQETGEVSWDLEIESKQNLEKLLEYSVKFPKKQHIRIE